MSLVDHFVALLLSDALRANPPKNPNPSVMFLLLSEEYKKETKLLGHGHLGKTLLSTRWVFWKDSTKPHTKMGMKTEEFAKHLSKSGSFGSLQELSNLWIKMQKYSKLHMYSNIRVFRQGVTPLWEDPQNKNGGRFVVMLPVTAKGTSQGNPETSPGNDGPASQPQLPPSDTDEIEIPGEFVMIILHIVCGVFGPENMFSGCVLSVRRFGIMITIWTSTSETQIIEQTRKSLALLMNYSSPDQITFQQQDKSLKANERHLGRPPGSSTLGLPAKRTQTRRASRDGGDQRPLQRSNNEIPKPPEGETKKRSKSDPGSNKPPGPLPAAESAEPAEPTSPRETSFEEHEDERLPVVVEDTSDNEEESDENEDENGGPKRRKGLRASKSVEGNLNDLSSDAAAEGPDAQTAPSSEQKKPAGRKRALTAHSVRWADQQHPAIRSPSGTPRKEKPAAMPTPNVYAPAVPTFSYAAAAAASTQPNQTTSSSPPTESTENHNATRRRRSSGASPPTEQKSSSPPAVHSPPEPLTKPVEIKSVEPVTATPQVSSQPETAPRGVPEATATPPPAEQPAESHPTTPPETEPTTTSQGPKKRRRKSSAPATASAPATTSPPSTTQQSSPPPPPTQAPVAEGPNKVVGFLVPFFIGIISVLVMMALLKQFN